MKLNRAVFAIVAISVLVAFAAQVPAQKQGKWKKLMDGKSFKGWKISEPEKNSWKIENGAFVANGPRSHLFYVGDEKPFVNFEFRAEVMTKPGSNGGIYIHTQWQETGWPKYGYEVQVNQTQQDWRKSGSLYSVEDVREQFVRDNEWYTYDITVKGRHITIKLNDKVAVDWEEPADRKPGTDFTRILDKGTFALQAHDPGSTVYYRNIMVRRLD